MVKRAFIRLGDRTTHGGTVVGGDPTFSIYGKNVARVGDLVACPRCKGSFPIVSGAMNMWTGQNVARQDDMTSCGAKLIASQSTATWSDDTENVASQTVLPASLVPLANSSSVDDEPHAIRFQAIDPDTEEPIPKCIYILTRENGAQHGGVTDREGFTEVIETTQPEHIAVHFMFKSPKGENIDREDLVA